MNIDYSKYEIDNIGLLRRDWKDLLKSENAQNKIKAIRKMLEEKEFDPTDV